MGQFDAEADLSCRAANQTRHASILEIPAACPGFGSNASLRPAEKRHNGHAPLKSGQSWLVGATGEGRPGELQSSLEGIPMKVILGIRRATVFSALLWSATVVVLAIMCSRIPAQPGLAASPQSPSPAAPRPTNQKLGEYGVWRHFGESSSRTAAEPAQLGVWRHFGQGGNLAPSPRTLPTVRNPGIGGVEGLEQLMYELVNRERADPANSAETNGRALPLRWNEKLAAVARAHSLDMLNQAYFAHEDREGRSVAARVDAAGMEWQAVGENIALSASVAQAEAAFMNEPRFTKNHRANILNANYTDVGIGIVAGPDGRLYITQDFYTPPAHP